MDLRLRHHAGLYPPEGFDVWARVVLVVELPTASGPKSARVYCGYRPGPTRVTLPSRQDDENVRAPALSRAVAWLCNWLLSDVCSGGRFTVTVVSARTLLDRLPVERVSGDLADSTLQLVRDTALLLFLLLLLCSQS